MDKKTRPCMCSLQETHLRMEDTHRVNVKGWKKISHANGEEVKAGAAVLISEKIDFKTMAIVQDKERYYIMIKKTVQQKDLTLVNM